MSQQLVNEQFDKIVTLKDQADQKETQLQLERVKKEHYRKIGKMVKEKIEFKTAKAYKRQNSYLP